MTRPFSSLLPWLAPLLFAAVLGWGCAKVGAAPSRPESSSEPPAAATAPTVGSSPALKELGANASIADVAERVLPSVVNISMTKPREAASFEGSPFPFFFGPTPPRDPGPERGMGSGVIVSADGTILTNNHVVAGATEIKVTTHDGREFTARVVGTDPKSDLAVVRIDGDAQGLQPIEFGESARLRLGEVVLAVGNPFGIGQTVTMGIVSAQGRADLGIVDYEDFIQTDAAINPGNSGGALVNTQGKLVGINTAILSRSGGYQGIGFAIPTDMAQPIMESLKQHGKVVRGWLGVAIQDVDADLAAALKLTEHAGVVFSDVRPGTPAEKAGLRRGDVVVKLDDKPIKSVGQFRNAVAAAGAARVVKLEILREGRRQLVPVSLGEMPEDEAKPPAAPSHAAPKVLDGLALEELTAELRRRLGVPAEVKAGVAVTRVVPGSTAARAGLRPGDVLLEVNRQPIDSLQKFQALYARARGNVLLLVQRQGGTLFVVVKR